MLHHHCKFLSPSKVLGGAEPNHRPADLLEPELEKIKTELLKEKDQNNFDLSDDIIDDILTYALFPQVALYFFKNRKDLTAFEPIPDTKSKIQTTRLTRMTTFRINQNIILKLTDGFLKSK